MKGQVIYFTDEQKQRADIKFEEILMGYDFLSIKCVNMKKTRNSIVAIFDNGDLWELNKYFENIRGKKCNISYIPRESNDDHDRLMIVKAMTVAFPYNGIIYY